MSERTWPALQLVAMGSRCGKLCAYPLTSLESCELELHTEVICVSGCLPAQNNQKNCGHPWALQSLCSATSSFQTVGIDSAYLSSSFQSSTCSILVIFSNKWIPIIERHQLVHWTVRKPNVQNYSTCQIKNSWDHIARFQKWSSRWMWVKKGQYWEVLEKLTSNFSGLGEF